jgi:hypothetical protein
MCSVLHGTAVGLHRLTTYKNVLQESQTQSIVQLCNCAIVQLCNCAIVQLCNCIVLYCIVLYCIVPQRHLCYRGEPAILSGVACLRRYSLGSDWYDVPTAAATYTVSDDLSAKKLVTRKETPPVRPPQ